MATPLNVEIVPISEVPRDDLRVLAPVPAIVLVVDDEPVVADTLATILSHSGFETMIAYSAEAALKLADQIQPAFLISDVHMPGMNGVELAITLMKRCPACRVLLFSGHASTEDLKEARAAGYDFPLLAKPVHPAEIIGHLSASRQAGETGPVDSSHPPDRIRPGNPRPHSCLTAASVGSRVSG